jgi:hypothetical protein
MTLGTLDGIPVDHRVPLRLFLVAFGLLCAGGIVFLGENHPPRLPSLIRSARKLAARDADHRAMTLPFHRPASVPDVGPESVCAGSAHHAVVPLPVGGP